MDALLQISLVLIGGLIGIGGTLMSKIFDERRERRALAYALAGEIGAILEIIKQRGYEGGLQRTIKQVETSGKPWNFRVRVEQNYFTVYEANSVRVGLLPRNVARDVSRFYTYAKSLIEDVTDDKSLNNDRDEALRHLNALHEILEALITVGRRAISELERD